MDAKTMCGFLRLKADLQAEHDGNNFASDNYREIADFIEQQEKQIAGLIDDNGQQHIEIMLLSRKNEQQEKYAELGRLAVKVFNNNDGTEDTEICIVNYWKSYKGDNEICKSCVWRNFCQKRAELLAEVQYD